MRIDEQDFFIYSISGLLNFKKANNFKLEKVGTLEDPQRNSCKIVAKEKKN